MYTSNRLLNGLLISRFWAGRLPAGERINAESYSSILRTKQAIKGIFLYSI